MCASDLQQILETDFEETIFSAEKTMSMFAVSLSSIELEKEIILQNLQVVMPQLLLFLCRNFLYLVWTVKALSVTSEAALTHSCFPLNLLRL